MKKKIREHWKGWLSLVCVLALVMSFTAGCSLGVRNDRTRKIENKSAKIMKLIDTYYLDKTSGDAIEQGIYKGLVNGLDDPYSVYYTPEEYKKLNEETSGSYVGIGVTVQQDETTGYVRVVQAFEGGTAYKAGIRSGDLLTEIEGEDINGQDLDKVVARIRGKEGTSVSLKFYHPDTQKYEDYTIRRKSVDIPTVESQMLDGDIGYIKVSEFDVVTADQFIEKKKELEDQGEKGLIIDLRDNPGGVLQTAVKMLQDILPAGKIVYTRDKNGKGDTYRCDGKHEFKKPLVILVNENSASASEIFTGAVKDYGIGKIVGTKTFGKGIVQQVFELSDGSAVKLTTSRYYTPKGVCIHKKGIEPDVEIEYDKDAMGSTYDQSKDNQLNKALEVIKGEIGE